MPHKLQLESGNKILFTGDSITDASRTRRVYRPLGFGYAHFTANMLRAGYPGLELDFVNTGISGNTIRPLSRRWQRDCIELKPDILSILIGANDVWRSFQEGKERLSVPLDEFTRTYRDIISYAVEECGCQIVLIEPFMFCADPRNPILRKLRDYIKAVREIAAEFNAALVPVQAEIDKEISNTGEEKWSIDYFHPRIWAHMWIAQKWCEFTGLLTVKSV